MKLELDEFLPYRLSVCANRVSQVIARAYEARFGLRSTEWRVMAVLAQEEESSQQGLVFRTGMDKVAISRAAQQLEERGFLRRRPDPQDARSLRLSLTAAGKRVHARIAPEALALQTRLLEGFPRAEVEALSAALKRIEQAADDLLEGR